MKDSNIKQLIQFSQTTGRIMARLESLASTFENTCQQYYQTIETPKLFEQNNEGKTNLNIIHKLELGAIEINSIIQYLSVQ
jgi:hypothetical protein